MANKRIEFKIVIVDTKELDPVPEDRLEEVTSPMKRQLKSLHDKTLGWNDKRVVSCLSSNGAQTQTDVLSMQASMQDYEKELTISNRDIKAD